MAMKSKKPCNAPRCSELVSNGGYCDKHKREWKAKQPKRDERESACKRGYDRTWRKVAKSYMQLEPLCELCQDYRDLMVHHKKPLSEGGERLDFSNLQTLCRSCHAKEHGHG